MRTAVEKLGYAFEGLSLAWRDESSFRFQVLFATGTLLLGAYLSLSLIDFAVVLLTISLVLAAEVFNTALEELCDKFQPTEDPHIKRIKDLAAAAVLLSSLGAFGVGVLIFAPYL